MEEFKNIESSDDRNAQAIVNKMEELKNILP